MSRKITLAILSLIISVSVILTPSLSAFAFGNCSLSDYTAFGIDCSQFRDSNYNAVGSTQGMPAYHIKFDDLEICEWIHSVRNASDYVSSYIVFAPVINRYYFIVKQRTELRIDGYFTNTNTGQHESQFCWSLGYGKMGSNDARRGSEYRLTPYVAGVPNPLVPIRFWFNSYYYIFFPISSNGASGGSVGGNAKVQQYESVRYSEMKAEELAALAEASGSSDLEGIEGIGGIGEGASDYLTEPAVDASSESEQFSEEFSGIDEMISNIDDFSELASSNLAEVSGAMSNTRSALNKVLEWLPRPIIIFCIFGLVVLIIVKIMGR